MGIDLETPSHDYCDTSSDSGNGGCSAAAIMADSSSIAVSQNESCRKEMYRCRSSDDGINLNSSEKFEPHDGMEFESKEEAFSFYKKYAESVGFETIIKASRRSRISGKFIDAKFVCTRYGSKKEADSTEIRDNVPVTDSMEIFPLKRKRGRINRSGSKTDCKACLHVKRRQNGRWIVHSFVKEHNHEIFPDQTYCFGGQKILGLRKGDTDALHAVRGRTKKLQFSMSAKSSEHKQLRKQKSSITNQTGSVKRLAFEENDAKIMLNFCIQMQEENPNFFYAVDLDDEQRLRNIFWVDAKGRLDSQYFSDVVSFDTTYIRNEYKLPVVLFIGVNHHVQLVLLGCALLGDESKATYIWLMQAWLRATGSLTPSVILTDQNQILKETILEVFPSSRHCFCQWHILSMIPEKLGHAMREPEVFMKEFNKCVFESCNDEQQFEKEWWEMVDKFDLGSNTWVQSLYEYRERWIPLYTKDAFLAGMSTNKRSESINSVFDKHVQRKTTIKEFLGQYKVLLQQRFEEEAKADFETWHRQPGLKSPSPFGKQMASLYTHEIFKKFQVEVVGCVACHPRKVSEDGPINTFQVQDFEKIQQFIVVWKEESHNIFCSCRLFEFNGFLCRHTLIVLQVSGVQNIPSHYILRRWTKDAKNRNSMGELVDVVPSRTQRYKDLCTRAFKLSDEGSLSEESYNIVFNALEEALRKCENLQNLNGSLESTSPTAQDPIRLQVNHDNSTSKMIKNDTAPKNRQVDPGQEALSIGMHETWQLTGHSNVEVAALGCPYARESMEGMTNPIAPNLDDDFGPHQIAQGMAHLSSVSQIHDAHYIARQGVPGMGQLSFGPRTIPTCFYIQDALQDTGNSKVENPQLHAMLPKQMQPKHLPH